MDSFPFSPILRHLITVVALMLVSAVIVSAQVLPGVESLPSRPELPNPLTMLDGTPITTREQWYEQRRPELKTLFQQYVYGYAPAPEGIISTVTSLDPNVFGGRATMKQIEIRFRKAPDRDAPRIRLLLFTPNHVKGRVPVFLITNRCGNHSVLDHPDIVIDRKVWVPTGCKLPGADARGEKADFYCVEYLISRGYAFATFYPGDIAPDDAEFTGGIFDLFADQSVPRESRWGTIAVWAWSIHRVVDYLTTDVRIDRKRICVTGHSRRGKTALLSAALDERIALCVPHQSGTGGCALSRNNNQETVERINKSFPHWFNGVFPRFGGNEDKLPVDQHLLIALVAPRPLLDTEGKKDAWANPDSALEALRAADPVYKLLGVDGMKGTGLVQDDEDVAGEGVGNLVQHRLDTIHTMNQAYWKVILDFADKQLGARPVAR